MGTMPSLSVSRIAESPNSHNPFEVHRHRHRLRDYTSAKLMLLSSYGTR